MSNIIPISITPLDRNTRAMERLAAAMEKHNDLLGAEQAKEVPRVLDLETGRIAAIQQTVANYFGQTVSRLIGQQRMQDISVPRQIAMALCRRHTKYSSPVIGRHFGGRDHSTVLHAVRQVAGQCAKDADYADDYAVCSMRVVAALDSLQQGRAGT